MFGAMKGMTPTEYETIRKWIVQNVTSSVVPLDEGNSDGLVFNLLQLLREGSEKFYSNPELHYQYTDECDKVVECLYRKYGVKISWENRI